MESGVLDKGDIQKVQGSGSSRIGLGTTVIWYITLLLISFKGLKGYPLRVILNCVLKMKEAFTGLERHCW